MGLADYSQAIAGGMALVPDYGEERARDEQRQLQQQALQHRMAQAQQQLEGDRAYQADLEQVLARPTAEGIARLSMKHGDRAKAAQEGWATLDKGRQQSDLRFKGEVVTLLAGGNAKRAAESLRARVEADRAAGQPDDIDNELLLMLESDDPAAHKMALGMMATDLHLTGGDEGAKLIERVLPKPEYTETNNIVWDKNTAQVVGRLPGGDVVTVEGMGAYRRSDVDPSLRALPVLGGGAMPQATSEAPATAPPATLLSGPQGAVQSVLATRLPGPVVAGLLGNFDVEGGYGGAQGDGGSASGIAQWRLDRRDNFKRMFGKEPHEAAPNEQAQFVQWEFDNPERAGMTVAQRDAILAAKTPEQAAALIDKYYLRSSGQHRDRRIKAAGRYGGGSGMPMARTKQEYDRLPSGTQYTAPDGSIRVKG